MLVALNYQLIIEFTYLQGDSEPRLQREHGEAAADPGRHQPRHAAAHHPHPRADQPVHHDHAPPAEGKTGGYR